MPGYLPLEVNQEPLIAACPVRPGTPRLRRWCELHIRRDHFRRVRFQAAGPPLKAIYAGSPSERQLGGGAAAIAVGTTLLGGIVGGIRGLGRGGERWARVWPAAEHQ